MFPLLCLLFHLLGVLIYFSQEVLCKKFSLKYKMQTKKVCKSEMYSSHFCKMITVFYSAPSSKSGASLGPKVPFMRHLMIFTSQIELSLFLSFICPLSFLLKKKRSIHHESSVPRRLINSMKIWTELIFCLFSALQFL